MHTVRKKSVWIDKYAYEGMNAEKPPIKPDVVMKILETPDKVEEETKERRKAMKWEKDRTIIVYYDEWEDEIDVKNVSSTRRKIV